MSKNKINKFSLLSRVVTDNDRSNNCNNGSLEGMASNCYSNDVLPS